MTLFLHIGCEKTASTSIQSFLFSNRDKLAERCVCFPQSPSPRNHVKLASYAQRDDQFGSLRIQTRIFNSSDLKAFRSAFAREFLSELQEASLNDVIVSSELFSSYLLEIDEVERLRDLLAEHTSSIKVVVYLRRQDRFLLSTYSTAIKAGATHLLQIPSQGVIERRYDYEKLLNRWAEVFGESNMIVRTYENGIRAPGGIIADFLACTGLELDDQLDLPARENASLDASSLEFLRRFNERVPRFKDGKLNVERRNIVPVLMEYSGGEPIGLDRESLKGFRNRFLESNAHVARRFFDDGTNLFDDDDDEERDNLAAESLLDLDRAIEIAAHLWIENHKELSKKEERIRTLQNALRKARTKGGVKSK